MPGAPAPDHKCNKNGKHRNCKQRRKSKTERKRTHENRTCLFSLVQDKKAETKVEFFRKQANHPENTARSHPGSHIHRQLHNYLTYPRATPHRNLHLRQPANKPPLSDLSRKRQISALSYVLSVPDFSLQPCHFHGQMASLRCN